MIPKQPQRRPQGLLSSIFILACALTSVAEATLGLPVDSNIDFNSTCKVKTVFVNGSGAIIEISLSLNLTHGKMPHHGGCFNLVSASQIGSLYRLICAEFGEVMSSNSCIKFSKAPMKDLCHYGVEKLDFNKTSEDGLPLLIVTLKRLDSFCGKKLKLAYETRGLSKDEACDFQCKLTTPSNNNSLPGTSPVSTPSKSVPTEASNSSAPSESTQPNSVPSGAVKDNSSSTYTIDSGKNIIIIPLAFTVGVVRVTLQLLVSHYSSQLRRFYLVLQQTLIC